MTGGKFGYARVSTGGDLEVLALVLATALLVLVLATARSDPGAASDLLAPLMAGLRK
ncbi:MAG: hypothetical protein ACT4PP_12950 [Sporichthyaceae bacterium]